MSVFTAADRERVRGRVLALADADARVVAGAVVGSLAHGDGDRFSDLDLTFAVADGTAVADVLGDWTRTIAGEFAAVALFDLPSGATIYRVFLLPGCLQFDLSFTPASAFGATGPGFRLLFGEAVELPQPGRRARTTCSATPCTTWYAPASASSVDAAGRRSTGSAAPATAR